MLKLPLKDKEASVSKAVVDTISKGKHLAVKEVLEMLKKSAFNHMRGSLKISSYETCEFVFY